MNKSKNIYEIKGITLIALVITVIVMLIIAGVAISAITTNGVPFGKMQEAVNKYNNEEQKEEESINNILAILNGTENNGGNTDGSFDEISKVNTPDTSKLPADITKYVTWTDNGSGTYEEQLSEGVPSSWYDYNNGKWANIKSTANNLEAYWVWIPRFAYKLPESETAKEIEVIFVQGNGKTGANGESCYYVTDTEITTDGSGLYANKTADVADKWIIHPAFTFGDTQLTGIWVGKYETSSSNHEASNGGDNTTGLQAQIKPSVTSWRNIQVANAFTVCENIKKTGGVIGNNSNEIDTHMMKNIEWGAVAILSQSAYGVYNPESANGGQIWINPNSDFITGQVGDNVDASGTTETVAYNTGDGPKASTTGTVYGVYDMSGGGWEYVMGLMDTSTEPNVPAIGYNIANNTGFTGKLYDGTEYTGVRELPEKKYYNLYAYGTSETDYTRGKIGDATEELKPANNATWNSDYAYFGRSRYTVFKRGGYCNDMTVAGIFSFDSYYGHAYSYATFRAVLIRV